MTFNELQVQMLSEVKARTRRQAHTQLLVQLSAPESYFTQESGTSDLTKRAKYFYPFEDKGHNRNVTSAEGEQYECQ